MPRFVVLADTHFHPASGPAEATHGSDAWFNARNAAALGWIRQAQPDFVVHLGDLVHPTPGRPAHEAAMDAAAAALDALDCPVWVVPGNHDVGDKPQPWAPAPRVAQAHHDRFAARFNDPFWSVRHGDWHLLGLDTPIMGSGLPLEQTQWDWLEQELATPGDKLIFQHYPPFLVHPEEDEHYDNLAPPVRARLLRLFASAPVRAVFCGHVHHAFWHPHDGAEHYLLPATSFVRPGFAELSPVPPSGEHGRDERHRLGLCEVRATDTVAVRWVWSEGRTEAWAPQPEAASPLGLTLRHAWDELHWIPADNLDPYRRKQARDDLALLRAWSAGVRRLRLPLADLASERTRARIAALTDKGFSFVFFHVGPLDEARRALLLEHAALVRALEWIRPREHLDEPIDLPVPCWVAPHGAPAAGPGFTHFVGHGYRLEDVDRRRGGGDGAVVRIDAATGLQGVMPRAHEVAGERQLVLLVALPDAGEDVRATDDAAVAERVAAAAALAQAHPEVEVFLDMFVDHDRGYFPRNGLIDRRGAPRAGWRVLAGHDWLS